MDQSMPPRNEGSGSKIRGIHQHKSRDLSGKNNRKRGFELGKFGG